jgi:hypothetical protein
MNKNKKNFIFALVGLSVLMMAASSVSANEEPNLIAPSPDTSQEPNLIAPSPNTGQESNLIAPSPDTNEQPLIIAPRDVKENKDALSGDNAFSAGIILVIGTAGIAGLAAALIIFKKRN